MADETTDPSATVPDATRGTDDDRAEQETKARASTADAPSSLPADPPTSPAIADAESTDEAAWRARPLDRFFAVDATFVLTRFVLLRLLGGVYLFAFLALALEGRALFGPHGILPFADHVRAVTDAAHGSAFDAFRAAPSVFHLVGASDAAISAVAWTGVTLAALVAFGLTNAGAMVALWILYASFVNLGRDFTSFGWEIQILETGILAAFLCPLTSVHPFPRTPPPLVTVWSFRWLIARIMLGAGLIKIRNDACWRDLTCLAFHYETQPIPNPLSRTLHHAPLWFHEVGVVVNHVVELVAPFFAFGPRIARTGAGLAFVTFQLFLIASGNLSFLNWLTIVPAVACFDDAALRRVLPGRFVAWAEKRSTEKRPSSTHRFVALGYGLAVAALSLEPMGNLLSKHQAMNRSYEPLHLVNTYGAFGSVGRERFEVILEGTRDAEVSEATAWLPFELPCKPGDVARTPCVLGPFHHRLDWQLWFLPFGRAVDEPWFLHLVEQMLKGEPAIRSLFARYPFEGNAPPTFVRGAMYRYRFTPSDDASGAVWERSYVGDYLRPVSLDDVTFQLALDRYR